ncbi:acetyltransferase [Escherichia coli]|uniref:Acetyltransferase n=1 Tax=Escherichia coli TaxID=562 RepID=A0AAQ2I7M6_ECOLX|nr:acetyltransferase [Escherichia coli]EFI8863013.1 acetyltransferase [Escherichia coli]OTC54540.1 acetyltransferase [Escherichia coli]TJF37931.1 acetyltransferase [Escherichia coli]TJG04738.1 acetyltransferase [Escherichia coli]
MMVYENIKNYYKCIVVYKKEKKKNTVLSNNKLNKSCG